MPNICNCPMSEAFFQVSGDFSMSLGTGLQVSYCYCTVGDISSNSETD